MKPVTFTMIPDAPVMHVDIFAFDGFHERLS
jgi:hypothetical protein